MDQILEKIRVIRENWIASLGVVLLTIVIIMFILILTGRLDCELTSLKGGVYQTCDCTGLEITVKSITNSGEQKTICVGRVQNRIKYK
jgi:hypothetical protein